MPTEGMMQAVERGLEQAAQNDYGPRKDGTRKGRGWLGEILRPDGSVATEISAGVSFDGRETEIPLLVPSLAPDEVEYLRQAQVDAPDFFQKLPPAIMQKAVEHAKQRMKLGLSPFNE